MFIVSWLKFIPSLILHSMANILHGAADMAYNWAKIGLPIIQRAQCNQHGEADTAWGRHLDSFQF